MIVGCYYKEKTYTKMVATLMVARRRRVQKLSVYIVFMIVLVAVLWLFVIINLSEYWLFWDEQNKIANAKIMAMKIKWSYGIHGKRNNLIDMMSKCLYINKN
jgi:hypothetical protein